MKLDVLIRGGTVYDGISPTGRVADVGIANGRFVLPDSFSRDPKGSALFPIDVPASRIIDAAGKAVMPGFVDIHTHSDLSLLVWPNGTSKLLSGVTTDVCGNCGSGAFPLNEEGRARREEEYSKHGLRIDWSDAAGYFARLEASPCAINRAVLVGHGNLRGVVIGYDNVRASRDQIARMRSLLEEGLSAGAFGMSTGLIYPPSMWGDVDEIAALAEVIRDFDGYYTSHIRSERDGLLDAVDEFIAVLDRARCRGLISHLKAAGRIDDLRQRFEQARARGLELFADCYPYTASCTSLAAMVLPGWALEGTSAQRLARLGDQDQRQRMLDFANGRGTSFFDNIRVIDFGRDDLRHLAGKSLTEIGQEFGRPPADAAIDLLVDDRLQSEAIHFCMTEEEKLAIYSWPFVMVGSDYSARDALVPGDMVHPRAFGTSAAFLGKYVRDAKVCDWPTAARKLATMPADMLGLTDRGRIAPGCWGDVVVLDPAELADRATYIQPRQTPTGIDCVLVNGVVAVEGGKYTEAMSGKVLKKSR